MKLSRISLVLGLTVSAMHAPLFADDAVPVNTVIPGKEKIKQIHNNKTRTDNMYFVRFKDEPVASYRGGVEGLAATHIQTTNNQNKTGSGVLNLQSSASINYSRYLEQKQQSITASLSQKVNRTLKPKHNYKVVLNAVAVELTESEAKLIAKDPNVAGVDAIGLHQLHTSSGPQFIGSKDVWSGTSGGVATKGEGVIVGIIDSGINALHPSFAEVGGDGYKHINPLGEGNYLGDCIDFPKYCNNKLIGIVSYPDIVNARPNVVEDIYDDIDDKLKVGYDFNGHGSHVASTAAGNIVKNVPFYMAVEDDEGTVSGPSSFSFDDISGVAPHANIVSYQVCDYNGSCYPELTVLAIEHAIEKGVNVLNYSVGGSARDPWGASDALAFLNARTAGIHVATSAGNAGPEAETIGAPGNSPWITTVAAYSHDRAFTDKTLSGFSGGETLPSDLTGKGATAAYTGKVVLAADYDDAKCLQPFAADTFNGEIVVCERGDIARVRKGLNVLEGGAGGLILINTAADGVESLNADTHLLPAIHLSTEDGEKVVEWLSAGSDHTATIGASDLTTDPELGDIAGVFTSRGPNYPFPNIFAPDIAAPGVDIYAAHAEEKPFAEGAGHIPYVTYSGTSMASPHVAGALALISSVHPSWTPAQVQSAVMSTAYKTTYKDDDFSGNKLRSDFFDQGAGSIRVNDAVKAGLLLDITEEEYLAVSPQDGGDPSKLNTTSMVMQNCISNCTFTRVVTATQASSWTADYEYLNPGFTLEVSPSSFSLAAGQSQTLTITARANIDLADEWVHGYVMLKNADSNMSDTHLQATIGFKAGEMPAEVNAKLDNVDNTLKIEGIVSSGSDALQAKGFGLYKSVSAQGTAIGSSNDAERNSPWMYHDTLFITTTVVKPYTKRLIVEISESTSPDMDLFVGIDEDGDGKPSAVEVHYSLVCISGNEDSNERCIIETPTSGNYWIFAHNYRGTVEDEADDVTIRTTHIAYTYEESFTTDAPSAVAQDEEFDVTVTVNGYLDDKEQLLALEEGEVYYGLFELGTKENLKRNIGGTLLKVEGLAPQEVIPNEPPVVANPIADINTELNSEGNVSVSVNLSEVFTDPENDPLTLTFTGNDELTLADNVLSGTITQAGTSTIVVSATDGEFTVTTQFNIVVAEAPVVVPPPAPEPEKDSGGGSLGFVWLAVLALAGMRRQVKLAQ
ncbi:S8 family serine peptidase [Shewanella gaetbuli]|nr:S8 family serine peptidase [Shewanella gaetbuli]